MKISNGNAERKGSRKVSNDRRMKQTTIRRFSSRRKPSNLVYATLGMFLLVLLSTHYTLFADAFANNLVVTSIGCMTDLSTDEIIMNEDVKPPEESDFPKMHLAVLDEYQKPIDMTTVLYDPTAKTLEIAFVNPYTINEFNEDLQFVMEIEGPTEDSRAAEFVSGGSIGCDNNKRVSGRLISDQAAVTLQINDPTAKLRLWGGWATGHNAVRLTPDLLLEPGVAASVQEAIEELEDEIHEAEFRNTGEEKLLREEEEEKLKKILDKPASESEDVSGDIAELEEEIAEQEFRNTGEEKLLREQEEEKLNKILNSDGGDAKKGGLPPKNLLQKPEHVPDGLIDPKKKDKDLGLEIARAGRERGQQGSATARGIPETKTIQQKLNEKQFDLDAANSKKNNDRKKRLHKLTDHTNDHRNRRDDPKNLGMQDDGTDDDLPSVGEIDPVNDDYLPDEGDLDDAVINGKNPGRHPIQTAERFIESSQHFLACAFFVTSMGLFFACFRKKRDKGRRDL